MMAEHVERSRNLHLDMSPTMRLTGLGEKRKEKKITPFEVQAQTERDAKASNERQQKLLKQKEAAEERRKLSEESDIAERRATARKARNRPRLTSRSLLTG